MSSLRSALHHVAAFIEMLRSATNFDEIYPQPETGRTFEYRLGVGAIASAAFTCNNC